MKLSQAIKKRYSCRSYSPKKVSKKIILELLELANQAPSAGNQQNRQFIVITNKNNRKYLSQMNNQTQLKEAPVVILATAKLSQQTTANYLKSLEKWGMTINGKTPAKFKLTNAFKKEFIEMKFKWMVSDVAAAVENLMLVAVEKGLSTCWIGIMDFKGVTKRFKLPAGIIPICLVTLGYKKEQPKYQSKRKNIKELVYWETYDKK
ncbi:nitroreductase family protein [Patescibacteria group bacterium]|nr:nitroreductase family protein [Patescibacteria group bacterium]